MKLSRISKLLTAWIFFAFSFLVMGWGNVIHGQQATASLSLQPPTSTLTVNQTATFTVRLNNPSSLPINAAQVFLSVDPTKLQIQSFARGADFADTSVWFDAFSPEIYQGTQLRMSVFSLGQTLQAKTTANLFTITVKAIAPTTGAPPTLIQFSNDLKTTAANKLTALADPRSSVLGGTTPTSITINGVTAPTATPTPTTPAATATPTRIATATPTRVVTPTPTSSTQNANLALLTSRTTAFVGETVQIDVRLRNPSGLTINGVQLFVGVNPQQFTVEQFTPSSLFAANGWLESIGAADRIYQGRQGRMIYVNFNGGTTLADVSLGTMVLRAVAPGAAEVSFGNDLVTNLPTKLTAQGIARDSVLGTATGVTVTLQGVSATSTPTPTVTRAATATPTRASTPTPTPTIPASTLTPTRALTPTATRTPTLTPTRVLTPTPTTQAIACPDIEVLGCHQTIANTARVRFNTNTSPIDLYQIRTFDSQGNATGNYDYDPTTENNILRVNTIGNASVQANPLTVAGQRPPVRYCSPVQLPDCATPSVTPTVPAATATPTRVNTPTPTPTSSVASPTPTTAMASPTPTSSVPTPTPTLRPGDRDTVVIVRTSLEKVFDLLGLKLWRLKVYARSDMSPEARLEVDLRAGWQAFPPNGRMTYNPSTDEYELDRIVYQEVRRVRVRSSLGGAHAARVPFDGFGTPDPVPTPTATPSPIGGNPDPTATPTLGVGEPTLTPTPTNLPGVPTNTPTPTQPVVPTITPTAVPTDVPNTVTAFIDPASVTVLPSGQAQVTVKLRNTPGLPVNSFQLFIDYNNTVLDITNDDIQASTDLNGWVAGYQEVYNNQQIRIQYLSLAGTLTAEEIDLFTLTFTPKGTNGVSGLEFVTDRRNALMNKVTALADSRPNVLGNYLDGMVIVNGTSTVTPTPTDEPEPTSTPTIIATATPTDEPEPTPTTELLSCGATCSGLTDTRCDVDCTCQPVQGSEPRRFVCGGGDETVPTPTDQMDELTPTPTFFAITLTPSPIPQPDSPSREEVQEMIRDALRDVFQRLIEYLNGLF